MRAIFPNIYTEKLVELRIEISDLIKEYTEKDAHSELLCHDSQIYNQKENGKNPSSFTRTNLPESSFYVLLVKILTNCCNDRNFCKPALELFLVQNNRIAEIMIDLLPERTKLIMDTFVKTMRLLDFTMPNGASISSKLLGIIRYGLESRELSSQTDLDSMLFYISNSKDALDLVKVLEIENIGQIITKFVQEQTPTDVYKINEIIYALWLIQNQNSSIHYLFPLKIFLCRSKSNLPEFCTILEKWCTQITIFNLIKLFGQLQSFVFVDDDGFIHAGDTLIHDAFGIDIDNPNIPKSFKLFSLPAILRALNNYLRFCLLYGPRFYNGCKEEERSHDFDICEFAKLETIDWCEEASFFESEPNPSELSEYHSMLLRIKFTVRTVSELHYDCKRYKSFLCCMCNESELTDEELDTVLCETDSLMECVERVSTFVPDLKNFNQKAFMLSSDLKCLLDSFELLPCDFGSHGNECLLPLRTFTVKCFLKGVKSVYGVNNLEHLLEHFEPLLQSGNEYPLSLRISAVKCVVMEHEERFLKETVARVRNDISQNGIFLKREHILNFIKDISRHRANFFTPDLIDKLRNCGIEIRNLITDMNCLTDGYIHQIVKEIVDAYLNHRDGMVLPDLSDYPRSLEQSISSYETAINSLDYLMDEIRECYRLIYLICPEEAEAKAEIAIAPIEMVKQKINELSEILRYFSENRGCRIPHPEELHDHLDCINSIGCDIPIIQEQVDDLVKRKYIRYLSCNLFSLASFAIVLPAIAIFSASIATKTFLPALASALLTLKIGIPVLISIAAILSIAVIRFVSKVIKVNSLFAQFKRVPDNDFTDDIKHILDSQRTSDEDNCRRILEIQ
jgi:hypothetical protein